MSSINRIVLTAKHLGVAGLIVAGVFLASCSSAPAPQPEPSKKEVQQDADRFFEKMKKEETQNPSPK